MTDKNQNQDANWDAALRKLAQRADMPAGADDFRKARWAEMLSEAQVSAKPRKKHWFAYAATAAVLVMVFSVAMFVFRPAFDAQTAIAAFDHTVAAKPVLLFETRDFVYDGHSFNLKSYSDNITGRVMVRLDVRNVSPDSKNPLYADISIYSGPEGGFVNVSKLNFDGKDILAMMGSPEGIRVKLNMATRFLCDLQRPKMEMEDIRSMVESLAGAGGNFSVTGNGQGVLIEGVVTRPEMLDVRPLLQATRIAGSAQSMVPIIGPYGKVDPKVKVAINSVNEAIKHTSGSEVLEKAVSNAAIELAEFMMIQQQVAKFKAGIVDIDEINRRLRDAARGAKIKIDYNRDDKMINSVTIDNYGPSKGIVNLRFISNDEFESILTSAK